MRKILFGLFACGIVTGCDPEEADVNPADPVSTVTSAISNLPKVVKAVTVSPESLSIASADNRLSQWSTFEWGASESRSMCFAGDVLRTVLSEAAGPDRSLCKLGVLEDNGLIELQYGGATEFFRVVNLDGSGGTQFFKLSGTKTGEMLTEFAMQGCNVDEEQESFVSTTLSGSGDSGYFASIRSVTAYNSGGDTGGQLATTSGTTNAAGDWSDKMIAFQSITDTDILSRNSSINISQNEINRFEFFGSFYGTYDGQDEASCFYSAGELLNGESLATLALGSGATNQDTNLSGQTCEGSASFAAWNGDTRAPLADATSSPFYQNVQFGTVPTLATFGEANVAFSGDDAWDCQGSFTEIDLSEISEAVRAQLTSCDERFSITRTGSDCRQATD